MLRLSSEQYPLSLSLSLDRAQAGYKPHPNFSSWHSWAGMKAEKHRSRVCSDLNNSPSPQRLATRPDSPRFQDAEMGLAGLQTSPDQPPSGPGTPVITGRGHTAPAHGRAPASLPAGATPVRPSGELAELGARREWVRLSLQGRTSHLSRHVWRPPRLTTPPGGSRPPPDSGLPVMLHGALGSTHWAPAWTTVLGALGGGTCRTPDHPPVKVVGDQRPPGRPRTAGKVVLGVLGTDRQIRACLNPQLCRWLTMWIF